MCSVLLITKLGAYRVDEERRLKSKEGIKYLADISDFDKQDVLDFWKELPFHPPQHQHNRSYL